MAKHGPIETPMTDIPGNPSQTTAEESCVYDGVAGYPKGSGGKLKEVTFDTGGAFGKVEGPASKG